MIKMRNGVAVRNVLIDNYVGEESSPRKNIENNVLSSTAEKRGEDDIPDFTVKTDSARSQKSIARNVDTNQRKLTSTR